MHFASSVAVVASLASLASSWPIPSARESALSARRLVLSEGFGTLSTVFPDEHERYIPPGFTSSAFGLPEYYADCSENGDLTLLFMPIATSFKNTRRGSKASLSVFPHAAYDAKVPADHPRVALLGTVEELDIPLGSAEDLRLRKCYVEKHPDAKWWLPGKGVHGAKWATFKVGGAYYVGGFGNHAYIGKLDMDDYKSFSRDEVVGEAGRVHKSGGSFWEGVWKNVKQHAWLK